MSTTRLLILGVVRMLQPVHGYDVKRELETWGVQGWANVAPGSIYHALKKLASEERLEEVATEREGGRPARTKYRVTAKGEHEFHDLLHKYWWEYKAPFNPFTVAFSFLRDLSPKEAAAALRNRARTMASYRDSLRTLVDTKEFGTSRKPPHVYEMFELGMAHAKAEEEWCERVAQRLDDGELPGELPWQINQT